MKHIISTVVGDFEVFLSYHPNQDDLVLNRFTTVINQYATQPLVIVSEESPDLDPIKDSQKLSDLAIELMDEAEIENALYASTTATKDSSGIGAGVRISFSLPKRRIETSTF